MKISITLPSLYPAHFRRAVAAIETNWTVDYEIVAVTPFEATGRNVIWVKEESPMGVSAAHKLAFARTTGDFVLGIPDDATLLKGWDELALQTFAERESGHPLLLGLHALSRWVGTVFGIYYPWFPFSRRSHFERLGYFPDRYRHHFCDADIGLRFWSAGGRCEFTPRPAVAHEIPPEREAGKRRLMEEDLQKFVSDWAPVYGAGWDVSTLRGFNLDILPPLLLSFEKDRTVFFNRPELRDMHENFMRNLKTCQLSMKFHDPVLPEA